MNSKWRPKKKADFRMNFQNEKKNKKNKKKLVLRCLRNQQIENLQIYIYIYFFFDRSPWNNLTSRRLLQSNLSQYGSLKPGTYQRSFYIIIINICNVCETHQFSHWYSRKRCPATAQCQWHGGLQINVRHRPFWWHLPTTKGFPEMVVPQNHPISFKSSNLIWFSTTHHPYLHLLKPVRCVLK